MNDDGRSGASAPSGCQPSASEPSGSSLSGIPNAVPVSDVRAFLRVGEDQDKALAPLVQRTTEICEEFIGRALISRDFTESLPQSPAWARLTRAPVRAIGEVRALSADSDVLMCSDDYAVDIDAAGDGWVRMLRPKAESHALVSYTAGLAAEPSGLPEALRHGIVRLAAHLYAHRDDQGRDASPPAAVTALWRPWRRLRLR